jgi:competence protein ComEC
MTPQFIHRPVLPVFVTSLGGIAAGSMLPGKATVFGVLGFTAAACAVRVTYGILRQKPLILSPLILIFVLAAFSPIPWIRPNFPENHVSHFSGETFREIEGRISTSEPILRKGFLTKFFMETQSITTAGQKQNACGKLRVTMTGDGSMLGPGDHIRFVGKIRKIRNFNNPGGFDYQRYMAFQKIWAISRASEKRLTVVKKNASPPMIFSARQSVSTLIDDSATPESGGVLKALIIGDRNDLSPRINDAFMRAGAAHLLAISGLHIGIVATLSVWCFNSLFSRFTFMLFRGWTFKCAAVCSMIPILGYGLLAGMAPSTQRAVIMVGVFLLSFLVEREKEPFTTLCLAGLVILVVYPPALFNISFQLSFLSVASILTGFATMQEWEERFKKGWKRWVVIPVLVSIFTCIGTLPLVLLYFNRFSLIGIAVNLMMVPIIGFGVVPLGLVSALLIPASPAAAHWSMALTGKLLDQTMALMHKFSGLAWASVTTVTPSLLEIFLYYATIGAIVWFIITRKKIHSGEHHLQPVAPVSATISNRSKFLSPKAWRKFSATPSNPEQPSPIRRLIFLSAMIALVACWLGDIGYWVYYRLLHKNLRVSIIDVGQGNSALLEVPGGVNMLIDGGGFTDNSMFDVGANIVGPFLRKKKISHIDIMILSHPNSDHLNGLLHVAENFHVKEVWTNGEYSDSKSYKAFMEIIRKKRINTPRLEKIYGRHEINGAILNVWYPPPQFLDSPIRKPWRNDNNNSMVVQVIYGDIGILFPGDIMADAEKDLTLLTGKRLKSTVMLVPHHGSSTSSTDMFLDAVQPRIAVVSSGWQNRFSFPHAEVLSRLELRHCAIYQTAEHGAIEMATDGRHLAIQTTVKSGYRDTASTESKRKNATKHAGVHAPST